MSDERIWSGASPEEVIRDLEPLVAFTAEGLPLGELDALLTDRLLPHLTRYDLPSFHSFFNMVPEEGALHGARVAMEWNQGVTNWQVSPGGAVLEELCCQALCRLFGLDAGADGTVMYSGTYANQQALYMALHRKAEEEGFDLAEEGVQGFTDPGRLALITSVDGHFSLRHAVRMLGLGERALIPVDVDENRRMDTASLRSKLSELSVERDVFCVVATAGTTSTGSVDPAEEIADICADHGCWLHVDGAYGLAYMLVPDRKRFFTGIERADSLSWDPHKQFGVPIPSSILFARRAEDLRRMAIFSGYWNLPDTAEPNPGTKSIPSTRPFTALPLVTSIRHLGLHGVIERLSAPLAVIREIHRYLEGAPDMECLHVPDTGILCFKVVPEDLPFDELDQLQHQVYNTILGDGQRSISITDLDGTATLRLVVLSPTVTVDSVKETINMVRDIAETYR
ncbi:pyridoxal phosphate-dependent decarboxylase family protein [Candidatus Zixiibacteriota bacterium]